jgi:serine/threonine protein kinase
MAEKIGSSSRAPAQEATGDDARYVFERRLGAGGAGTVHLVSDRETGERFALKKLFRMDAKSVPHRDPGTGSAAHPVRS